MEWDDMTEGQQLALAEVVADAKEDTARDIGELFKKWNRAGTVARFFSLKPWRATGMLTVDIGEVNGETFAGSTKCFVSAIELVTFLRRRDPRQLLHYGGGMLDGEPVSRIFKLAPWKDGDPDWVAKCGHFRATRSKDGGYIPDMKQRRSEHSIKLTDRDLDEIQLRTELQLVSFAAADPSWVTEITRRRRDG